MPVSPRAQVYWRKNVWIILLLLGSWVLGSYGFSVILVGPLQRFSIGALSPGFWFAHQGFVLAFSGLVLAYAVLMDRLKGNAILVQGKWCHRLSPFALRGWLTVA